MEYKPLVIKKFLVNRIVKLQQLCFFLQFSLDSRYAYSLLTPGNLVDQCQELVLNANNDRQLGDLVWHIIQYWVNEIHCIPEVLIDEGMIDQLSIFIREMLERKDEISKSRTVDIRDFIKQHPPLAEFLNDFMPTEQALSSEQANLPIETISPLIISTAEKLEQPTETRNSKPVIRYFVSYAHEDKTLKDMLLKPLKNQLDIAKDYFFEAWDDGEILAGDHWHEQIQVAVANCHFGLLLVSPAFLRSPYIQDHELQSFVASNLKTSEPKKRAVPIALKRILFDKTMDLKGLEKLQIFHYSTEKKTFQECCQDELSRDNYTLALFQEILKIVSRLQSPGNSH